jgi:hypothetical protein
MFDYNEFNAIKMFYSGAPMAHVVRHVALRLKAEKEPAAIQHRNSADEFALVAIVRKFTATISRHALYPQ